MLRRALLCSLLFLMAAAPAAARSLLIESFDVEVRVRSDGTIEVTETIRPRFTGRWNGIFRTIPVEYRTPQGFNYTLRLDLLSITDEVGNPLRNESSRQRHYRKFKIWVPGAQDATRTVVLRYRVANGLKFFEEHDELYWNVTGDEWEVPIEAARARIILPLNVSGLRVVAFTGNYGSKAQDADVEIASNEVRLRMRRRLAFREGLTAVVGWDKGIVQEPGAGEKVAGFLYSNWPFSLPIAVFALMFWLWHTRGRDPRRRPISPQYAPPAEMSPAEVGTLIDNSADMRDISATLVDLAVRGYLVIEEKEEKRLLGLWSDKDYVFHLKIPQREWNGLKPHERGLLEAVFFTGELITVEGTLPTIRLSDLQNKFYKELPGLRDRIFRQLLNRRYYLERPDKVKRRYLLAGIIVAGVAIWGGTYLAHSLGVAPLTVIVSALLSAGAVIGFGWFMPARTQAGTRALEGVLGFEEFLARVEADRYDRMVKTPETFEKFLPFAMALGVEKNWADAFADIYKEPPRWYVGGYYPHGFHVHGLTGNLGRMSARAGAVMASAPRGSGGSGFGGGGFSGGGFGGGGGGGF